MYSNKSPHSRGMPFDNSSNGFTAIINQDAIEEAKLTNPAFKTHLFDDFITGTINSTLGWAQAVNATGSFTLPGVVINSPGVIAANVTTGTLQPQGSANFNLGTNNIQLGGGQLTFMWRINIPVLATAAQDYNVQFGLGNLTAGEYTSGVYFRYNRATSANWLIVSANAGTRTTTITTTPVTANTYYVLKAVVNATATSVEYFISTNSGAFVSVGTITTNIPTTPDIAPALTMTNIAGTNNKQTLIDFFELLQVFTTKRYIP